MVTWWVAAGRRVLSSGPEVIDDLYSLSGVPCKPSILRQFHPARKMERNRVGPKPATRDVNGSRSKFLLNFKTVGRCTKVTANPQTEISENSYGQAISTPKTQIETWKQKRENQLKSNLLKHTPV